MKNLSKIRDCQGYTQTEVAKALNVARNTVSQWENSKRDPDCETLLKLSNFFNVSIDELLGNDKFINNSGLYIPAEKKATVELLLNLPNLSNEHLEVIQMLSQLSKINLLKVSCYTAGLLTGQN